MAQRVRVPQFGKWDDGNAAYTMIFENARKDKNGDPIAANPNDPEDMVAAAAKADRPQAPGRGPKFIINPNDPEQNPQAFRAREQKPPPANHQPPQSYMNHNNSQTRQRQGAPGRRPPEPAANYGALAPASPLTAGHHGALGRKAAVPKFGGWNETGNAPAEGYTVVFNKVKEEKQQIAGHGGVPAPSRNDPQPYQSARTSGHNKPAESFWTKLLSCFNPSAN